MVMGELEQKTEVLVIGSGPGGYAAAFRAADLGLEVTMVDPSPRPGGRCLYHGCIPAKSLIFLCQVMRDAERVKKMGISYAPPDVDLGGIRRWQTGVIDDLADKLAHMSHRRDIHLIAARARFEDARSVRLDRGDIRRIRFAHAVIATGARSLPVAGIGAAPGGRIMNPGAALRMTEIPETLLIIGSGYIGLEIGTIYATLGSRIHLVESGDRLLPDADQDLVAPLRQRLDNEFESIHLKTRVESLEDTDRGVEAVFAGAGRQVRRFRKVLAALGGGPAIEDLGLENTAVKSDEKGFIRVDGQQRTADDHILAVGDVTGGVMLAHTAARQGRVAAETIAGKPSGFDVQVVPAVVATDPQIAWCGITEEAARRENRAVAVIRLPWRLSDRAVTIGATEGLTKLIVDPSSGRLIGAGIAGRQAEALISEAVLAIEMGALAEDVALCLHPVPGLAETQAHAAEIYLGRSRGTDVSGVRRS